MQILGSRSKVLLIAVAIVMLVAIGVSFAAWDSMATVKATSGDLSTYANAKVGDIVEFGRYYQTGNKVGGVEDAEYEKTPIEWIVVDKDERTGQLTLMSKYILAAGSYFGNYYYSSNDLDIDSRGYHYQTEKLEVGGIPYNQVYAESTIRAYLNNLERRDLGGDSFDGTNYLSSVTLSDKTTGKLLTSVGFSNRYHNIGSFYKRPIYTDKEFINRPATRGFYDEAFTDDEKAMLVPKIIPGYTGHRWPCEAGNNIYKSNVEGAVDKVWLPSPNELNNKTINTNPSDEISSTVFEYFKNYTQYKNPYENTFNTTLLMALAGKRTPFVIANSFAMNYSIPVYKYQSTEINGIDDISSRRNSSDHYWTRSPRSDYYGNVRIVNSLGSISDSLSHLSYYGVRPCVILKY